MSGSGVRALGAWVGMLGLLGAPLVGCGEDPPPVDSTSSLEPTPSETFINESPTLTPTAMPTEVESPTAAPTPTASPTPSAPPTPTATPTPVPDADGDGYDAQADCDDLNPAVNPGASEICDGIDNNCDGVVDLGEVEGATTWYPDFDGDGYGNTSAPGITQCAAPERYVATTGDCDDGDAAFYPGAPEEDCADANDYNCDGSVGAVDGDGDGYAACEECDDEEGDINPSAVEICDGVDNDCDGLIDDADGDVIGAPAYHPDADGDGYGVTASSTSACVQPEETAAVGGDCDDDDGAVNPETVWYLDRDGDLYGDDAITLTQCARPANYALLGGDCDDGDDAFNPGAFEGDCADPSDYNCDGVVAYADTDGDGSADCRDCAPEDGELYPGAAEVCDGVDNDCDGQVDDDDASVSGQGTYYPDADGDGYGEPEGATLACGAPEGAVTAGGDCDDDRAAVNPATVWYLDQDGDGYGDEANTLTTCAAPDAYVLTAGDCQPLDDAFYPGAPEESCGDASDYNCDGSVSFDDGDGDGYAACEECDDGDAAINPGADEVCDGVDNDCDGAVDDDDDGPVSGTSLFYVDADGDGYGDAARPELACAAGDGLVANALDCDDTNAALNPTTAWYFDGDGDGFGGTTTVRSCLSPGGAYVSAGADCDDTDDDTYPGAPEACDGGDANCDGVVDSDGDGDGFAAATCGGSDCDDTNAEIFPEVGGGCALGASCREIQGTDYNVGDGLYTIDPDGFGVGGDPFEVYCIMDEEVRGGGWTLIQRTVWEWEASSLIWTGYEGFYTETLGSAAPRNPYRAAGYWWPHLNQELDFMAVHRLRTNAGGACEPLYYIATGAAIAATPSGSATISGINQPVTLVNSSSFSTKDTGGSSGCVTGSQAIPWFYSSCCTTCPTFKSGYWNDEPHPMQSYTQTVDDEFGHGEADVCGLATVRVNDNGSSYRGVDSMEFYLR